MHQAFHENYIEFFTYFNGNADYFECHEVFEELWKEVASNNKKHVLVGFILVATGMYHWRRGNIAGAKRSMMKGIQLVKSAEPCEYTKPVDLEDFLANCSRALAAIEEGRSFEPFTIVLTDDKLAQIVTKRIATLPANDNHFIQNKHMLRDRSDVIAERAKQLKLKQKQAK